MMVHLCLSLLFDVTPWVKGQALVDLGIVRSSCSVPDACSNLFKPVHLLASVASANHSFQRLLNSVLF